MSVGHGWLGPEVSLERELGRGAFGLVFRGRYRGQQAALKLVPEHLLQLKQLLHELKVYRRLDHKNVVKLLGEPLRAGGHWILPLELIDGSDLEAVLFQPHTTSLQLSREDESRVIRHMCRGLAYLHGQNVVHQDLKPDNIMVESRTRRAVIVDLSLSKLVRYSSAGERHSEGATGGNQAYCAPEILNNQHCSKKSDTWALGKMAAEVRLHRRLMLTGCVGLDALRFALLSDPYSDLLLSMLDASRDRRPDMEDVARETARIASLIKKQSKMQKDTGASAVLGGIPVGEKKQALASPVGRPPAHRPPEAWGHLFRHLQAQRMHHSPNHHHHHHKQQHLPQKQQQQQQPQQQNGRPVDAQLKAAAPRFNLLCFLQALRAHNQVAGRGPAPAALRWPGRERAVVL
uniref:calcium-dependent protein kinase 4-like n=1 Tax=Myxine glutinosa TaxID=7769 RepID=UPI00358E76F4